MGSPDNYLINILSELLSVVNKNTEEVAIKINKFFINLIFDVYDMPIYSTIQLERKNFNKNYFLSDTELTAQDYILQEYINSGTNYLLSSIIYW